MSDIDDTLGNLRDYFSSQPYQQMMKNITEISNRLKSSLSEINLDAFDAITSSAIQSTNAEGSKLSDRRYFQWC